MKIIPYKKATIPFIHINETNLFEDEDGSIYMKIGPVNIDDTPQMGTFNAVDVVYGRFAYFRPDDNVVPVYGSFHTKESPDD